MRELQVGIVGFGRIGAEHAGWIGSAAGVQAAAVQDVTPARRQLAEARGLRTYDRLDQMLAEPTIDIILICSPTAMHFEQTMLALEANKHVMVEKPFALDLEQSRRLTDEAHRRGRVLSVFHNRRWDIDYLTVNDAVKAGSLGRLINVESRLGQFASCVGPAAREYRPTWRNEAAFGGGGLYDWGSHFVDQLWRLLWPARPVRIFAQLRGNVWTSDCDDFARLVINFDNDAVGLCEINTTTTRPLPRWHLDGSGGSASSAASAEFNTDVWAQLEFTPAEAGGVTQNLKRASRGLTESDIWQRFSAAVRGEGPAAITPESVLPTMALMDAARESSRRQEARDVSNLVKWVY